MPKQLPEQEIRPVTYSDLAHEQNSEKGNKDRIWIGSSPSTEIEPADISYDREEAERRAREALDKVQKNQKS